MRKGEIVIKILPLHSCKRMTDKRTTRMYNPLLNKKPYGASVQNQETRITFPVDNSLQIKRVFVVLRQVFGEGGEVAGDCLRYELPYSHSDETQDFFVGAFSLSEWGIWKYRFEGEFANGDLAFFGRGLDGIAVRGDWLPEWQLTVTKCDYKTPNWAKQGVTYQIFADRFCKVGDKPFTKKGRLHGDWYERPDIAEDGKDYRADDFFGGNINGIVSKLDYLKSLGVSLIYLSPIFESCSNHRYDTGDYLKIDSLFGTEEEFAELVRKANEKGIRIMLDGVFNHTGSDSGYFNKEGTYDTLGAYQSKQSPYYDWYYFTHYPDEYACWWGSTVVPTVNKSAKGFCDLILGDGGVVDKWSKLGVKGWRLDVVDELPIDFTDKLCARIRSEGDDMLVVGEVWEDASVKIAYSEWRPYFMGEQLDSVMNYPFKEAILSYVLNGDKNAFIADVTTVLEHYPKQSLDVLMNLVDSHDTARAITVLSGVKPPYSKKDRADFTLSCEQYDLAKRRLKVASALQYTLPGVPCVFYGDEAGKQGFEDPLNRGTYPWGREDTDLIEHYRALGKIREKYKDLLQGETHFVKDSDKLIFERVCTDGVLRVESQGLWLSISVNGKVVMSINK